MTFGSLLKKKRLARNESLATFSNRIGISITYLRMIENSKVSKPTEWIIKNIASYLNKDLNSWLELAGYGDFGNATGISENKRKQTPWSTMVMVDQGFRKIY